MKPKRHHLSSSETIAYARECMRKNRHLSGRNLFVLWTDEDAIRRNGRKNAAEKFRKEYTYGSVIDGCISNDRKTCIWPGDTFSWQDAICVVTKSRDLDETRVRGSLNNRPIDRVFFDFRKSLIVEIEDLEDSSSKLRQRFHHRIEKPFGVVSVIPDTRHVASCVENGEIKAIKFLQEKMNSDTIFNVNETIQTTISAFQHLFQKEFTTDEIQVSVMDPDYKVYGFEHKDPSVEELNLHQIKEHLDVINKCGPPCHEGKTEPRPDDSSSCSRRLHELKLPTT